MGFKIFQKKTESDRVLSEFIGATIPLYKLRSPAIKEMFKKHNIIILSEYPLRREVTDMGDTMKILSCKKMEGKNFSSSLMEHNSIIENLCISYGNSARFLRFC